MADNLLTIEQLAQRLAVTPKALRQRLWRAPATLPATIRIGKAGALLGRLGRGLDGGTTRRRAKTGARTRTAPEGGSAGGFMTRPAGLDLHHSAPCDIEVVQPASTGTEQTALLREALPHDYPPLAADVPRQTVARLAALPPLDYDQTRKTEASGSGCASQRSMRRSSKHARAYTRTARKAARSGSPSRSLGKYP